MCELVSHRRQETVGIGAGTGGAAVDFSGLLKTYEDVQAKHLADLSTRARTSTALSAVSLPRAPRS